MPPRSVTLRRLGPGDVALLRAMNVLFEEVFGDPAYRDAPPDDAYLEAALAKSETVVVAALADAGIVGGLVAYELRKLEQARCEFYLYDLAVDAGYRRQGVATALIGHLQGIAAERNAWTVFVQADHGDDAAVALYERYSGREDVMHFDIPVGRRPTDVA